MDSSRLRRSRRTSRSRRTVPVPSRGGAAVCSWLLLVLCSASAWAQNPPPQVLPELVVTATRVETPVLSAPAFVTVISAKQIADSPAGSLPELLRSQGGLLVSSAGPTGALSTVSIRGSTSSQVLVLLDGVPLNSALNASVDLSQIPLDMVKRIEIVHGGESSVYGSNAIGGVIDIITREAGGKPRFTAKVENGSYVPHAAEVVSPGMVETPVPANPLNLLDTQRLSASASTHIGPVGLEALGGFTRAANGFVWKDSTYIDNWRQENHAGGLSGNGYLSLEAPLGGGTLTSTSSLTTSSYDVAGTLSGPGLTTTAVQQGTTGQEALGFTVGGAPSDPIGVRSKLYYQYNELHYTDPATSPATDSRYLTNAIGGDVTTRYRVSDRLSLVYGASGRYDNVSSTEVGARSRLNLAGFVSMSLSPAPKLTLTPSARYDYFSDVPSGVSYRIAAVLSLGDYSSLKGSLGESYRVPTIDDLYWPAGPFTAGNPSLKPETAYAGDFGYSLRLGAVSLDAALFARVLDGQIIWAPSGNPLSSPWTPQNLGRSFFPGAQIEGKLHFLKHLSLSADYSFIYSFLLASGSSSYTFADNRRVPFVPMNTATGTLAFTARGARVALEGQYVGREFTDDANSAQAALAAHVVLNLSYRQAIATGVALTLTAKNLLNSVYETQAGYPMPPFSLWTGLSISR